MDGFFELMFYLIAAPFWIAWKILVFVWTFVIKPLIQLAGDYRTQQLTDQIQKDNSAELAKSNPGRANQIAQLIAEANKSVPEKMRALIQINDTSHPI
jgi:hypothetical protein